MFPKPLLDRYRQAVVDKNLGAKLKKAVKKASATAANRYLHFFP